ncbi:uncharacterized protein [Amphiura filiformis]|uniref:uncharacterized protein n=1 Tax=Amphiura filiformis TaxID=82378 RepID=UPI003B226A67
MEISLSVKMLLFVLLGISQFGYGQTQGTMTTLAPPVLVPLCEYINRTDLAKSVNLIPNAVIKDVSKSNADMYFTLTSEKDNNTDSFTVTVTSRLSNETEILSFVVFAVDFAGVPQGTWSKIDHKGVLICDTIMGAYKAIAEFQMLDRVEYKFKWSPSDSTIMDVIFSATVRLRKANGEDVFLFGIRDKYPTIAPPPPNDSGRPRLPINIIVICASAFLLIVLIISLSLCCVAERKKRRQREDGTPLQGVSSGHEAYQFREGAINGAQVVHNSKESQQVEIPKPNPRFLSDVAEKEIQEAGGTLARQQGSTEISRSHVIMQERIGEGAFGDVYKAQAYGVTSKPITTVAVKILKDPKMADTDFKNELKVLMTFEPHPNIIQLMGVCTEGEPYFLVLEFAEMGDLRAFLHAQRTGTGKKKLNPNQLITFAVEIATGMEYIESKLCVHRDLATRNVLLGSDLVCKLSDFGLARNVALKQEYQMQSDAPVPVRWMAPESIRDNTYSSKSDVFSFGVLCWELVTMGSHPWGGYKGSEVIKMVLHGQRLEKPDHCSVEMYDVIMASCWQDNPARRPGFANLKQQLQVMLANAEAVISTTQFDTSDYVYLLPEHWQNSDGEPANMRNRATRKTIPNNYYLQFDTE